jgi:adenylate cyclase class 2
MPDIGFNRPITDEARDYTTWYASTHGVETAVGDFAAANDLLGMLGFTPKSYQENRRTSFVLGDVQLEMDEWPMIPPYLEIEGATRDDVVQVAGLLGYSEGQLTGENTIKVYARYGIDLTAISDLRFPDDSRQGLARPVNTKSIARSD